MLVTFLGLPRVVIGIRERKWIIELKEGERNQKREREGEIIEETRGREN